MNKKNAPGGRKRSIRYADHATDKQGNTPGHRHDCRCTDCKIAETQSGK